MQKYKCNQCDLTFTHSGNGIVECPDCGSTDAKPCRSTLYWCALGVTSLVFVAAGYFVTGVFVDKKQPSTEVVASNDTSIAVDGSSDHIKTQEHSENVVSDDSISNDDTSLSDKLPQETAISAKMTLTATTPHANSNGKYSFSIKANNVPEGATVTYKLLNKAGNRIIATSASGSFVNITPDPSGVCIAVAVATKNGEVVARTTKTISGFAKQEAPVGNKLSVSEVQSLFSSHGLTKHPSVAKNVRVSFIGLHTGDGTPHSNIADVYYAIKMRHWSSAHVTSVSYDATGKVNHIQFSVTYPASED